MINCPAILQQNKADSYKCSILLLAAAIKLHNILILKFNVLGQFFGNCVENQIHNLASYSLLPTQTDLCIIRGTTDRFSSFSQNKKNLTPVFLIVWRHNNREFLCGGIMYTWYRFFPAFRIYEEFFFFVSVKGWHFYGSYVSNHTNLW